jgi:hypothetical protein
MIKEILIQVNPNYKDNSLGIKCEADTSLTVGDFIRVVDSLKEQHIKVLKQYMEQNPNVDAEKVTFKDMRN